MSGSLAFWLWVAASTLTGPPVALDFEEISTQQSPVALDLIRAEQRMGSPDPILIVEGAMSADGVFLYCRPGQPKTGQGFRLMEAPGTRLCVLRIDFTLRPLVERKEFRRLAVALTLAGEGVSLRDLYPRNLTQPGDRGHSLAVSLEGAQFLSLPAAATRPGIFSVEDLRPVVVGFPQPGPGIFWELHGEKASLPLSIGSRRVFGLLSILVGEEALRGTVRFEADIGFHLFDTFRMPGTSRTHDLKFEIKLLGQGKEESEARRP